MGVRGAGPGGEATGEVRAIERARGEGGANAVVVLVAGEPTE